MTSPIQRVLVSSTLRSVLSSLALVAFIVAPATRFIVTTAGSNWN